MAEIRKELAIRQRVQEVRFGLHAAPQKKLSKLIGATTVDNNIGLSSQLVNGPSTFMMDEFKSFVRIIDGFGDLWSHCDGSISGIRQATPDSVIEIIQTAFINIRKGPLRSHPQAHILRHVPRHFGPQMTSPVTSISQPLDSTHLVAPKITNEKGRCGSFSMPLVALIQENEVK